MNKYQGTQTEKNLQAAFAGESQARNKYTYFASVAKKEGFEQIAEIFLGTADNEKEHAKMWFKELAGIGDTAANLEAAASGENFEWTCTRTSQKPPRKRALRSLRQNSAWSAQSKSATRSVTAHCLKTCRPPRFSRKAR